MLPVERHEGGTVDHIAQLQTILDGTIQGDAVETATVGANEGLGAGAVGNLEIEIGYRVGETNKSAAECPVVYFD